MVIPLNSQQFPSVKVKMVESDGTITTPFYYLLLSLFNRSGGADGVINNSSPALAAAGSSQATATLLTSDYSEVLTGSGGVRMRATQQGQQHVVYNGTGNNLNIYPPVGGQIDALGINQPYVLSSGKTQQIRIFSTMTGGGPQYRSAQLG